MNKTVQLNDGSAVLIRDITADDIGKSVRFFQSLPDEDRRYLRVNVSKPEVVAERIRSVDPRYMRRLVVLLGDEIIADGSIEVEPEGWKRDIGELRLIVSRPYQRRGVGMILARELYFLAAERGLERIMVRFMRPQEGARRIAKALGFHEEGLLPDYVRDVSGHLQDLVIMTCNLSEMWDELEDFFMDTSRERHK